MARWARPTRCNRAPETSPSSSEPWSACSATQPHTDAVSAALAHAQSSLRHDVARLSAAPEGNRPVTLGIGEPFSSTVTVTFIFALILSLPVLLLQAYGFFMPAFEPEQRRRMLPVMFAIPLLFAAGVAFGYLVVLPAALHFFQNFNSDQFNVLVQASQYYKFAATILLAMGLVFQVPVAIIAATRAGLLSRDNCDGTAATRYSPAASWPPCSPGTRSPCCSRPCRFTCCSSSA